MTALFASGNVRATDGGKGFAGYSVFVVGKGPLSAPPPQCELVAGLVGTQLCRRLEQ
jgi:hypothetical protein